MKKAKKNLKTARGVVYNCNYHIVFSTKYRRKVLTPPIAEYLKKLVFQIAYKYDFEVAQIEVGERDHVHIFVSAHPKIAPAYIVKLIKGITARKIFQQFPEVKRVLRKGHLWNPSYYIETIGSISEDVIRKYIEKQKNY